jgi:hypothetical protein
VTLAAVRAAAVDHALVGDRPERALALAGAADGAARRAAGDGSGVDGPLAAVLLAVGATTIERDDALDEGAWEPGADPDPLVLAGAAVAVRSRDVGVERAAELANCTPATLRAVVESRHREAE